MILRTMQLAKWRKLDGTKTKLVDVTIKSGEKILAPSWDLLGRYKAGETSEEEYIKEYFSLMRERYVNNLDWFIKFCMQDDIAIACYCNSDSFCHRFLLVEILEAICKKHNIPFVYLGEL